MKNNTVVKARIGEQTKEEAANILAALGLTISDAFRMLLVRIVQEKSLPFSPLIPNKKTINAMSAARQGKVTSVDSINKLMEGLTKDN